MMVKMLGHIFFFIFGLKFAKIQLKNYNILLLDSRGIEMSNSILIDCLKIYQSEIPTIEKKHIARDVLRVEKNCVKVLIYIRMMVPKQKTGL